jgi:hypothetical protein
MAWYQNTGSENIVSLTVSYDLFQFRINTAFTTVTFYYSTDGLTWTSFSAGDAQPIDSGSSAYNFFAPVNYGRSAGAGSSTFTITGLNIPINGDIYLRWNFKTFGSSNSEGLGLDNVSVTASFCTATNVTGASATTGNGKLNLSWTNPSCFDEILIVSANHNPITSVPLGDGSAYSPSSIYGGGTSGDGLDANEFAVYEASGSSINVTGLNNTTTYYFKFFTRRGTTWSSGVSFSGTPSASFAGDFRRKANGNWTNSNTWEKFSGGVWMNATPGEYPNDPASSVTISAGNTVTVNGAGPYTLNDLIVESSGKLYTKDASANSNTYISVYGNITCDGVIGNSPTYDDIAFNIEASNCTISGSGTFTCSRIRKQWTNTPTNLAISMDITTLWNSFSSTQLYNYSSGIFNITINSGYTFTCTNGGNVAIDGVNGLDAANRKGTLNVYGTLTIPGILYLTTNNTSGGSGIMVNIFNGGIINANSIIANASGIAKHTLHIRNGGKLNITGTAGWSSFSNTNNVFTLDAGSTIEYSAAGDQTIEARVGDYSNLTCSGSGNKILNADLTVTGILSLTTSSLSIGNNTLAIDGSITGGGFLTGSVNSNLNIGGTGGCVGTLNLTPGFALLDLLTIDRTATGEAAAAILGCDLSINSLTLSNGILVTGKNLLTWNNNGGALTAPQPTYTPNSTDYIKSFIATCDEAGAPINVADATTPFSGNAGFRIRNIGNADTYFPVGASFLPAMDNEAASPNRIMINNESGTPQDFTVVVNYGDIGYTNGSGGALRVNRIWYVKSDSGKASMALFFTKRDWMNWGTSENEVEAGFNYARPAVVEKDYSGYASGFMKLSGGADINDSRSNAYNTEIYALYSAGISDSIGIQKFNRFSVVNPGDIILPVNIINLKAFQKGGGVQINWTALNESNIERYEIQRSDDGINFTTISIEKAANKNYVINYTKSDSFPQIGNNFYRIKIIDKDLGSSYSSTIKCWFEDSRQSITVYPNPVINKSFTLKLFNLENGKYNVSITNNLGSTILNTTIVHEGAVSTQKIELPFNIAKGVYYLKISNGVNFYRKQLFIDAH